MAAPLQENKTHPSILEITTNTLTLSSQAAGHLDRLNRRLWRNSAANWCVFFAYVWISVTVSKYPSTTRLLLKFMFGFCLHYPRCFQPW